jgi:hypothetical protein
VVRRCSSASTKPGWHIHAPSAPQERRASAS